MKLYKLTDKNDQTKNNTQWGKNITHEASGEGSLCGPGWLHAYTDPLLAVLLNPIHGDFDPKTMHLWECEGKVGRDDAGLKVGCEKLTSIRRLKIRRVTTLQQCRFAIFVVKEVYMDKQFNKWANDWLSGKDRTETAARNVVFATACAAARNAAFAAARAAACAAARAAACAAAEAVRMTTKKPLDLISIAKKAMKEYK